MSNAANTEPGFTLEDWAALVKGSQREAFIDNIGYLLEGEIAEFLYQHGYGHVYLAAQQLGTERSVAGDFDAQALDGFSEEIGDVWWFSTAGAEQEGSTVDELCRTTLDRWTSSELALSAPLTIQAFEKALLAAVPDFKVVTKAGLQRKKSRESDYVDLISSPAYVFTRAVMRINHSYGLIQPIPPYTASDLEPPLSRLEALGDLLGIMTYITVTYLDKDLEQTLFMNLMKLKERETWGRPHKIEATN